MDPQICQNLLTLADGHELHYSVVGTLSNGKPILICIVGSVGIGSFYNRLGTQLSANFNSVYFDRRGFGSSGQGTQASPPSQIIPQQAKDVAALITAIRPEPRLPVFVLGTSFGATIALELLISYSDLVHTVVLHEPMLPTLLPRDSPEREMIMQTFIDMQTSKQPFTLFSRLLTPDSIATTTKGNDFWSRSPPENLHQAMREALAVNYYHPQVAVVKSVADKIILMGGGESVGLPIYRMVEALSTETSKRQIYVMPGSHFSFVERRNVGNSARSILAALKEAGKSGDDYSRAKI